MSKTINLDLTTVDGNAFALLFVFRKQAQREGWTADEIKAVTDEAKGGGDYAYLVATLADHCNPSVDATD